MGYRRIPTIHTLNKFDDYEGFEIRLKGLKLGKVRSLVKLMEEDDETTNEVVGEMIDIVAENLVSWNLEDEEGTPIPADAAGIDDLELPMLLAIVTEWLDQMTGVSDDLGKGSGSGVTSPVELPTMESL
jgi:hypothetical protein